LTRNLQVHWTSSVFEIPTKVMLACVETGTDGNEMPSVWRNRQRKSILVYPRHGRIRLVFTVRYCGSRERESFIIV
jgi:hypothetical protein